MNKDTTPIVDAIGNIHFEGNITPHTWYQNPLLHFDSGLVNLAAITLLADIVYWYRPTQIKDERTNRVLCERRKFEKDMLQKDYAEWAKSFGLTKRQVQDAIAFLKDRGIITVVARTEIIKGRPVPNVMFFAPVVEAILALNEMQEMQEEGITFKRDIPPVETGDTPRQDVIPSHVRMRDISLSNVGDLTPQRLTNTKSTTEISPKITQKQQQHSAAPKIETELQAPVVVAFSASLLADLIAEGVGEKVARGLVKAYPEEIIQKQLDWLPQRKCENPAATLVESIKQSYGAPAGVKKAFLRPKRVLPPSAPPVPSVDAEQAMRQAVETARKRVGGLRSSAPT